MDLWQRNIPETVLEYFEDLEGVLRSLPVVIRKRNHVVALIGDSQHGGLRIDTAGTRAEIGQPSGCKMEQTRQMRSTRPSAQPNGGLDLSEPAIRLRGCTGG